MAQLDFNGVEQQVEIKTCQLTLKSASVRDTFCHGVAFGTVNSDVRVEFELELSAKGCDMSFAVYDRSGHNAVKNYRGKARIRACGSVTEQLKLVFDLVAANHL